MYMNLKLKHKTISFNAATMASLGFIGPPKILGPPLNLAPPLNVIFCSGTPQLFWSEIFRSSPKIRGAATMSLPKESLRKRK